MELSINKNIEKKRYEVSIETKYAFIDYIEAKDTVYLTHTEVPKEFEGKGIASKLVVFALEDIENKGLKLAPLCPFVAAYVRRKPEWKRILSPKYNV